MKLNIIYISKNADQLWKKLRWENLVPTCKCGCTETYTTGDNRYKCKKCGYTFSDTSNTILQNSKLGKDKWLCAIFMLCSQKSISVRELASTIGVSKSSAWLMLQKIRSYMNLDNVDLSGVVCMDEAHIGGWCGMHFNKKMEYMRNHHFLPVGVNKYTRKQIYAASSEKKQHILCSVNAEGKAVVQHIKGQITRNVVRQVVAQNGITHIISDESKLYQGIKGVTTEQSNHSKHIFITSGGHTSNPCENRFSWVKRIVGAYHTHTSEKYLQLYLNQIIYKINDKDLSVEDRFNKLGRLCCKKYISNREVLNFDYTKSINYPVVNKVDWNEVVRMSGGLICQIEERSRIYRG